MKTTHLVASELFLVLFLAGCANLPIDQACRAGLESELKVLETHGNSMRYHRSPDFVYLLGEAESNEVAGDYQGCLSYLKMARTHRHERTRSDGRNYGTPNIYSLPMENPSGEPAINDAAHYAAGHTHHHGHN